MTKEMTAKEATLYTMIGILREKGLLSDKEWQLVSDVPELVDVLQKKNLIEPALLADRRKRLISALLDFLWSKDFSFESALHSVDKFLGFMGEEERRALARNLSKSSL